MKLLKGAFVTNRYYSDGGTEYAFLSLKRAFDRLSGGKIEFSRITPLAFYDKSVHVVSGFDSVNNSSKSDFNFDFVVFWDKDIQLARLIEKSGIRVFNNSFALCVTDDKQLTYANLDGIEIPKTVSAPLVYDVNEPSDTDFLRFVADALTFPIVVKANTGSQGRQVFLASTFAELSHHYHNLRHTPHHYQQLTGEFGSDIRVYTVGGRAIAACKRQGTDFKSNLAGGGSVSLITPAPEYVQAAENIATQLRLDFGAIDFLVCDRPVFLEANSNAYFTGIERLGADIAGKIAEYIISETEKNHA